jgi:hypothetical protein
VGQGFMSTFDAPPLRNGTVLLPKTEAAARWSGGLRHQGPNQLWTYIDITATKFSMHQYMFEAPIDEDRTRVFLLSFRNNGFFKKRLRTKLNNFLDKQGQRAQRVRSRSRTSWS